MVRNQVLIRLVYRLQAIKYFKVSLKESESKRDG